MGTETSGLVFYAWRADHYLRRTLWAGGVDIMLLSLALLFRVYLWHETESKWSERSGFLIMFPMMLHDAHTIWMLKLHLHSKQCWGGGGYLILFRAANETDFRSKSFRWEYKRHSCADVPSEKEEGCARPVAGQRIPGTWFNAFKVPFKQSVTWRVRTFMTRYYKLIDILQSYFYIKIFIKDHHVPSDASILSFKWEAMHFLNESQDNDKLI